MSIPRYPLVLLLLVGTFYSSQSWAQPAVEVAIEGVDTELETNVRLFLSIEQQREHPLMSDGRIRRLHQLANAEIAAALQPYGFYQPEITSTLTEQEAGSWLANYVIDPGPGIPIAEFNLNLSGEAAKDPAFKELTKQVAMKPGAVFVHPEYDSIKSNLSGLASERGYVQAEFKTTRVEIDLNAYVARVYLDFDSGPRYSFGVVSLEQDVLEPELLNRYIPFRKGDPFSLGQVVRLQQALNDSNYFAVVEVSPAKPLTDSQEIPINVSLAPRKDHRYNLGLGYGTDTGARVKFAWRMPRVNRKGHRIDSEIENSEIGYDIGANYRVPVLNPRTDQMVYRVSQEREKTTSNDSILSSVSVSLNHTRDKWRENLTLAYEREDFEVANDSGDSNLLIPGVSWTRTWGRDFINAIDGLRFDIGVRGASVNLASDTDFLQMSGGIKFITSFNPRTRLLLRGGFGTTSTDNFDQLPSSIRFFAGGSQSVRGYGYEELGPTDEDGNVVGGKHELIGSIEFDHYFTDNWGVAVFLDTGNAINSFDDDLEQGAGFGFRWKSPVGPVRIDLANAISTEEQGWRLHVSIGPDL